ncbi:carbon storage regulator CsrA [Desulfovibrio fairfieldensis]|uniref:Translational regulator CsrA n=1 Tax=Desulfovibrio fairfieldensis TaxID=44742 RepID=A0A0X8JI88_9BACT|nr:carbon storage regulator CsrA [Desulfovibrio fairfieldensis]AMD89303.1 carbon storage regulator [Desulfovibrio fairfieldensis]GKG92151.1 carbon storage regulator [Desulfovibrionaceae bacterium]GKI10704.1 carbon storage regulator [Desulfovibrionaceae bacterium]
MLILSRRAGESIYVGRDIRFTVLKMQGKQVKIGLEVPDGVTVYREEVYQRVIEQNQDALQIRNEDIMKVAQLWETTHS